MGENMPTTEQGDIQALRSMITAGWRTRLIYDAVRVGLFDALGDEPKTSAELAAERDLHEDTVFRVLRALATLGICAHVAERSFTITPMGKFLQTGHPAGMRSLSQLWGNRIMSTLASIGQALETGELTHGGGDFELLNATPFDPMSFNRAMADQSRPVGKAMAERHDFSRYKCVMDVGGGYGGLLAEVLLAYPDIAGAIYDLASVEAGADAYLRERGLRDRVTYLPGSFFENVAPGADCQLLKFILHDWNDEQCPVIMANCRAALEPGGKLLIVERIMPELATAEFQDVVRQDMVMLPIDGKERTLREMEKLGNDAGFELGKVTPLALECSLIEMTAV